MTEVRTTSATGGQKGVKPERYALLPRPGLDAIARVFGFGESKYAAHNWRKGYEWSKSIDALMRHVTAFNDGETNDPESGESHIAHAGFHVLVLLTWLAEQGEGGVYDDRHVPAAVKDVPGPLTRVADQVVRGLTPPTITKIPAGETAPFNALDEAWVLPDAKTFRISNAVFHLDDGFMERVVDPLLAKALIRQGDAFNEAFPPADADSEPQAVADAIARFVAGPYGVEDTDDAMVVTEAGEASSWIETDAASERSALRHDVNIEPNSIDPDAVAHQIAEVVRQRPYDRRPLRSRRRNGLLF